jgi:hypothetical protein
MVDMYRKGRALDDNYEAAKTLIENYPYFDADYVEEYERYEGRVPFVSRTGGPRFRCFRGSDGKRHAPLLTKVPLFYYRRGETFDIHIFEQWWLDFSPCYLGLLHFKFLPGAMAKIKEAVDGGYHWNNSFEYRLMLETFWRERGLSLMDGSSRKYESSRSLADENIIGKL